MREIVLSICFFVAFIVAEIIHDNAGFAIDLVRVLWLSLLNQFYF